MRRAVVPSCRRIVYLSIIYCCDVDEQPWLADPSHADVLHRSEAPHMLVDLPQVHRGFQYKWIQISFVLSFGANAERIF